MTRLVEGDVVRLRCSSCGSVTHNVVFSGENDMVTSGLIALASVAKPEVVIAEAVKDDFERADELGSTVQRRLSAALSRDDLRFVALLRAEGQNLPSGMSFQEFRAAYRPPRLIYACPHCPAGEASPDATRSFEDFEAEGGQLTTIGDLALAP